MEKQFDEVAMLKLFSGQRQIVDELVVQLIACGSLEHGAFADRIEARLRSIPDGDPEAAPLALMLHDLRPEMPPTQRQIPDWLRVIDGDKSQKTEPTE